MLSKRNLPNIVIHGYYGAGNFGDDIILLSMINSLRNIEPNMHITVLSRDVTPIPESDSFHIVSRFDLKSTEIAIRKADLFICGGGGIFHDYSGFNFEDHFGQRQKGINYYALPIEIAYLLGKRVMLYAIGAGPLFKQISRRYLKTVLNWADLITVRDKSSADFLKSVNPKVKPIVTADPAINYIHKNTKCLLADSNLHKKYVGICLRNWFFKDEERTRFARCFADMADYLIKHYGYNIVLFPFNKSKGDYKLLKSVHQNMKNKNPVMFIEDISMKDTVSLLRQMDFVVGMRLHSLVIAASNFIPVIGIAYDEKVSAFMSLLEMEDCTLSLDDVNTHNLKAKADAIITNGTSIKNRLRKMITLLKEKDKENAALAIELMRRGR